MPGPPLSERVERSATGRLVISALMVLFVLVEIGTGIPSSAIKAKEGATAARIIRVMGVEQNWGVFSPDPRAASIDMYAIVRFEDGTSARWDIPDGANVVENLRYYRWRKWLERIRADDYQRIWEPSARWIGSLYENGPSPVTEVELIRQFRDNVVSGKQPPYEEFSYYTLRIDEEDG